MCFLIEDEATLYGLMIVLKARSLGIIIDFLPLYETKLKMFHHSEIFHWEKSKFGG
jgi:hypothetical protein